MQSEEKNPIYLACPVEREAYSSGVDPACPCRLFAIEIIAEPSEIEEKCFYPKNNGSRWRAGQIN